MGRSATEHRKDLTMDILLGSFQNIFFGWNSYFFNMQIDRCFRKRTVLLENLLRIRKTKGPFKKCVTRERAEGKLTKN